MAIDVKISDKKLQYDINREAAKISALSSGKFDKYEYLTGEEIIPSEQIRVMEQAKFIKDQAEKQIKTIEGQREKQIKALKNLKIF